ncbi:MAG: hypothetical protein EOO01_11930 [Chitinophagaceae bacterium]|nr:MAG: hypothetical protein EOO01_11930 [Chitinophagaceae bacterium]
MAILIATRVKGQTTEGYDGILATVRDSITPAQGFIVHFAHPAEGEWNVYEVWESKEAADKWFAANIIPNLPKGIHPKRSYHELHSLVQSKSFELGIARFFNFMSGG